MASLHDLTDNGRWRPFAISAAVTLFVAGVGSGVFDTVLLLTWRLEGIG